MPESTRLSPSPSPSYLRTVLCTAKNFEVASCVWNGSSLSPLHAHGYSHCLVLIEKGIFENRTVTDSVDSISVYEPGQLLYTAPTASHELRCLSEHGKTFHLYSPKMDSTLKNEMQTGIFDFRPNLVGSDLSTNGLVWSRTQILMAHLAAAPRESLSAHSITEMFKKCFSGLKL